MSAYNKIFHIFLWSIACNFTSLAIESTKVIMVNSEGSTMLYNGTIPGPIILGTSDTTTLIFSTNDQTRLILDSNGFFTASNGLLVTGSGCIVNNGLFSNSGTASAPSYTFTNDSLSGMYSPGTSQLALVVGSAAKLNIDSTGSVTNFSQYKAHAYRATTQSVGAGTTTIAFNTETIDPNNNFNTTTGVYTVPVTGSYLVAANVAFTIASATTNADVVAQRTINLAVNGSAQSGCSAAVTPGYTTGGLGATAGSTGPYSLHTTALLQLNAGDQLRVDYSTTRNDTIQAGSTHFTSYFVSF